MPDLSSLSPLLPSAQHGLKPEGFSSAPQVTQLLALMFVHVLVQTTPKDGSVLLSPTRSLPTAQPGHLPCRSPRIPHSTRRLRAPRPGRELLRASEASGAAAPPGPTREPATAAPRPGDEPPLPCRSRRTQCQPSWSHKELCACARCGGAVAGARGIVGAVVQVERSARHCGSCSAEAGQHLDPPAVPPLTSGSRGG